MLKPYFCQMLLASIRYLSTTDKPRADFLPLHCRLRVSTTAIAQLITLHLAVVRLQHLAYIIIWLLSWVWVLYLNFLRRRNSYLALGLASLQSLQGLTLVTPRRLRMFLWIECCKTRVDMRIIHCCLKCSHWVTLRSLHSRLRNVLVIGCVLKGRIIDRWL